MIHDRITVGGDNTAFTTLADMLEGAYHNDFSTAREQFEEAVRSIPAQVLIDGRVQVAYPNGDEDREPKNIVEYAKWIGGNVISKYSAEEVNAPKHGYNSGNAINDRRDAESRIEKVIESIESAVANAKEQVHTSERADGNSWANSLGDRTGRHIG